MTLQILRRHSEKSEVPHLVPFYQTRSHIMKVKAPLKFQKILYIQITCLNIQYMYMYATFNNYFFLCPVYDSMGAYSFLVCLFVCPSSFTLWMQLVQGRWIIAFIFGMLIGHDVWVYHIIPPFWSENFCRSYETLTFSFNFNIVILCECSSSELVDVGLKALIFSRMIGHDMLLITLYHHLNSTIFVGVVGFNIFIYCEITFVSGVLVFMNRLIHEIKNSTNKEIWEAVWPRLSGPAA